MVVWKISYIFVGNKVNNNIMRFWHIVTDNEGTVKESYLVGNSERRLSLELSAELLNGNYEVYPTER